VAELWQLADGASMLDMPNEHTSTKIPLEYITCGSQWHNFTWLMIATPQ